MYIIKLISVISIMITVKYLDRNFKFKVKVFND